jgi:beta-glucuronidase
VIPDKTPGTAAFLRDARAVTLDLNPTLPTSVDTLSYPGFPRQEAYAAFDLLGVNSYFGWYPGKVDHSTANIADLKPYLTAMRRMYPRQGLVLTEFGAESTYEGPANLKETFAFQEDYIRAVFGEIGETPFVSGAIYWTLQEFAVKPHWDGGAKRVGVTRDGIHNKGLITYDGRRKPAWGVVREQIAATPLARTPEAVALATGIPLPSADRGRVGHGLAIAMVAAIVALLLLDVWAMLGWRRASRGELRDAQQRREGLAASAAVGERPRLRSVA